MTAGGLPRMPGMFYSHGAGRKILTPRESMAGDSQEKQPNGFRPIEEAPIRAGEAWGPAVIFPSETGWFAFAEWNG